ncbi:MAG: hypothetical protein J5671_04915 [Bacteroidaceae bacterium]|nr:hypothetical protein [Bacteroidaceae bacterium]
MAKYIYQEIGGITKNGEPIVKPRFANLRQVSSDEFLAEVAHRCPMSKGTLQAAVANIVEALPEYLAQGKSVRIEGLGLLTPTLTMKDAADVVETDESGHDVQHNAKHVTLDTIRMTPDKHLVSTTRMKCKLTHDRYLGNRKAMDTPYSREERLERAIAYLQEHSMLTVSGYMELSGLRHTMAAKELRELSSGEEARLKAEGRGSHRFYTLK